MIFASVPPAGLNIEEEQMGNHFSRTLLRAAVAVFSFAAATGQAQTTLERLPGGYPSKPIRLLVGNAPGGGIDITARAVGVKLGEKWKRTVVVDNRPGGAGLIAIDLAAHAAPDGYTLLVTSGSLIGSATAQRKLPFDTRKVFAPVSQLTTLYYLLMVNPSVPAKSVSELIAYAKAKPNALNYGSSGIGGAGHLAGALFSSMADIQAVHVPYKGGGLVLADMISGQIQMGFTATISGMPHVRGGKLRALGITSPRRTKAFPDLPTIAESGLPGFELINWYGLFAPAGTAPVIVSALHRETVQALGSGEVQAMFARDGAEATPSGTPAEFRQVFEKEVILWEKTIKLPGFAQDLR
jgi:tripartite-type tricarboxylate transporter receptor subunit TctC